MDFSSNDNIDANESILATLPDNVADLKTEYNKLLDCYKKFIEKVKFELENVRNSWKNHYRSLEKQHQTLKKDYEELLRQFEEEKNKNTNNDFLAESDNTDEMNSHAKPVSSNEQEGIDNIQAYVSNLYTLGDNAEINYLRKQVLYLASELQNEAHKKTLKNTKSNDLTKQVTIDQNKKKTSSASNQKSLKEWFFSQISDFRVSIDNSEKHLAIHCESEPSSLKVKLTCVFSKSELAELDLLLPRNSTVQSDEKLLEALSNLPVIEIPKSKHSPKLDIYFSTHRQNCRNIINKLLKTSPNEKSLSNVFEYIRNNLALQKKLLH